MALLDYEVPQRPKRRWRDAVPIAIAANAGVVLFVAGSYWLIPLVQNDANGFATAVTAYIGGVSIGIAAAIFAVGRP